MGLYIHRGIKQAQANARHHCCAGPGAAGQCLARATLKHAQADVAAVHHLHETHVHPTGESAQALDLRAQGEHRCGVHIVHQRHGMGVAHGNNSY